MAIPPLNPMITRCKQCGWSHTQNSDALQAFGNCPQCGSEALEISFAKRQPFSINSGQANTDNVLSKIKNLLKL